MTEKRRGEYIGQIALEQGLVTVEDIGRALELQQDYRRAGNRVPRLGEIFVGMGLLGVEDVRDLLRRQNAMLGEVPAEIEEEPEEEDAPEESGFSGEPARSAVGCEYSEGEKFGNYNLLRRVGYGPLGSAWCATYGEEKKKRLLLRIFSAEAMADKSDLVRNFEHHIIKATRLEHPGIQKIIRGGLYDDRYYYVCEFDEGQSLRAFLEETGRFSPGKSLELLMQISATLQYGHGKDFLHNHISPSSIIILPGFEVKLSAYGMMPDPVGNLRLMARELGRMPLYIAPELIEASGALSAATAASDFYSLGAVFYHALVGLPPFMSATVEDALPLMRDVAALELKLMDAEVDPELIRLTMALLAPDPTQRIKTAGELMVALAPLVDRFPFKKPKAENDRKSGLFANKGMKKNQSGRMGKALPTDRPQRIEEPKPSASGRSGASRRDGTAATRKDGTGSRREGTAVRKDGTGSHREGTGIRKDGTGTHREGTGVRKDGTGTHRDETGVLKGGATAREETGTKIDSPLTRSKTDSAVFAHKVKGDTGDGLASNAEQGQEAGKGHSTRMGLQKGWQSSRNESNGAKSAEGAAGLSGASHRSSVRERKSERRSSRFSNRKNSDSETRNGADGSNGQGVSTRRIVIGILAGVLVLAALLVYFMRIASKGGLKIENFSLEMKQIADAEQQRKERDRLAKEAKERKEREARELAEKQAADAKAKAEEDARRKEEAEKAAAEKAVADKAAAEAKKKAAQEEAAKKSAEAEGEEDAPEAPEKKQTVKKSDADAEGEEAAPAKPRRRGGMFLVDPDRE